MSSTSRGPLGRTPGIFAAVVALALAASVVFGGVASAVTPTSTPVTTTPSTSIPGSTSTTLRPTTTVPRPTTTVPRPTTTVPRPRPTIPRPRPTVPRPAPKWVVLVSLSRQHAYVTFGGRIVRDIPISSGSRGRTPAGRFRVSSKSRATSANGNPSVTMAYMTRFNGGIGFHGIPRKNGRPLSTPLGRRAVSHGCIRMADTNAKFVFQTVPKGSLVVVGR